MKRIITLTGLKQSGKVKLAYKWSKNENVGLIQPYTTSKKRPQDMIYLPKDKLDAKMKEEDVLCVSVVNGESYVYFKSQLVHDWNVIIADDYALSDILTNYKDVVPVWVDNTRSEASDRVNVLYSKDEFDYVYNMGLDDPDEFLEQLAFDVEMVQNA